MGGNQLIRQAAVFLRNLFRMLLGRSRDSIRMSQTEVTPSELLSTFAFRSDHIVRKTNTIHHLRLMPRRKNRNKNERLETSVCRSQWLNEQQIWKICSVHFDLGAPRFSMLIFHLTLTGSHIRNMPTSLVGTIQRIRLTTKLSISGSIRHRRWRRSLSTFLGPSVANKTTMFQLKDCHEKH